ncbi:MAG: hypothetical protein FJ358_03380 [Thaumarchaeota archaeon]|nr:hypothetical protein [Nitrososphaerota archaeon]
MNQIALAHTGEHIFMGSLQKIIPAISVWKVEQTEDRNSLFVQSDGLTWDQILQAEKITNSIISEGRDVTEYFFPSLDEAKKRFPKMRAIEERISGQVRVVEVEGYDHSACAREHASNSRECGLFLVTSFSKAESGRYEIRFEVGEKAKIAALEYSALLIKVANILGASVNTVETTATNLIEELEELRSKIREFSKKEVSSITAEDTKGVKLYSKIFEGLENKVLMEKAGELIKTSKSIVILANRIEGGFLLLAKSPDIKLNASSILKDALTLLGGKGGGKEDFASGSVDSSKLEDAFARVKSSIILAL